MADEHIPYSLLVYGLINLQEDRTTMVVSNIICMGAMLESSIIWINNLVAA